MYQQGHPPLGAGGALHGVTQLLDILNYLLTKTSENDPASLGLQKMIQNDSSYTKKLMFDTNIKYVAM